MISVFAHIPAESFCFLRLYNHRCGEAINALISFLLNSEFGLFLGSLNPTFNFIWKHFSHRNSVGDRNGTFSSAEWIWY